MDWGYTRRGDRKHILAEGYDPEGDWYDTGIALCGLRLTGRFEEEENLPYWVICQNCETLLSAMESV